MNYHKCCICGKFMKLLAINYTHIGDEHVYECKCGGYDTIIKS